MYTDKVINIISKTPGRTRRKVSDTVGRILTMSEPYRWQGKEFSFESNEDLDKDVNNLLLDLSNDIQEYAITTARQMFPEDEEDIDDILYGAGVQANLVENTDKYASHLKFILGGWLAIEFAKGLSLSRIKTLILTYMDSPFTAPIWKEAYSEGIVDFESGWGKGTPTSPATGMSLTLNFFLKAAWQRYLILELEREGFTFYKVMRGSDYDCERCDAVCKEAYPTFRKDILPVHPNCMCYPVGYIPPEYDSLPDNIQDMN